MYHVKYKNKILYKSDNKKQANKMVNKVVKIKNLDAKDFHIEEIKTNPFVYLSIEYKLYRIRESKYISIKNKYPDAEKNDVNHWNMLNDFILNSKYIARLIFIEV